MPTSSTAASPRQEADGSTTTNFIDLYKRGCFICETKQGVQQVGRREAELRPPSAPQIDDEDEDEKADGRKPKVEKAGTKSAWPKSLSAQVEAVRGALEAVSSPVTAAELAGQFQRANKERIAEILETLVGLGRARATTDGRFKN